MKDWHVVPPSDRLCISFLLLQITRKMDNKYNAKISAYFEKKFGHFFFKFQPNVYATTVSLVCNMCFWWSSKQETRVKESHPYFTILHNWEDCAQRNVPAKCFRIRYILCVRKPMKYFFLNDFVQLYIFNLWLAWSMFWLHNMKNEK